MQIPIITSFIEGLKLFFRNKRLKWLTAVFFIGVLITSVTGAIGLRLSQDPTQKPFAMFMVAITGGVWPVYFMLVAFVTLIGLQRFVASDESYKTSAILLIPWMIISFMVLFVMVMMFLPFLQMMVFVIAFFGWIVFQAYFSTRTALKYGGAIDTSSIPRGRKALAAFSSIFCYFVVLGAFIFVVYINLGGLLASPSKLVLLILGTIMALIFNFLNSMIMTKHRDKVTLGNIALIGLFISLYSAYFIYNAGKPVDINPDIVSIAISIFFVFYTMSSVGSMLASRADLDTFWKISPELAAALTFFLASGYYFADVWFPIALPDPTFGASISDLLKLLVFPFIALLMELRYLRQVSKAIEALPEHEAIPVEREEPGAPEPEEEPETPIEEPPEPSPEEAVQPEETVSDEAVEPEAAVEESPEAEDATQEEAEDTTENEPASWSDE
ncbi:MAG: hypothetical protein ACTSVD_00150 [Candidatus Thorarchaeota archaeon]